MDPTAKQPPPETEARRNIRRPGSAQRSGAHRRALRGGQSQPAPSGRAPLSTGTRRVPARRYLGLPSYMDSAGAPEIHTRGGRRARNQKLRSAAIFTITDTIREDDAAGILRPPDQIHFCVRGDTVLRIQIVPALSELALDGGKGATSGGRNIDSPTDPANINNGGPSRP